MKTQYWPDELTIKGNLGAYFELRAAVALQLIDTYGAIAGKKGEGYDTAGRATMELQTPEELVRRCFDIADIFVEEAEKRDAIRAPQVTHYQRAEHEGRMGKAADDARYLASKEASK